MYDRTPLLIVEDQTTLDGLVERLSKAKVLGVDTESDSMYHYQEKVCLLQLTDPEGDIIIDPLKVDDLSPLKPIFENPNIVKLYHGADYDVVCLKRDFGLNTVNLFDTLIAAQFLGFERLGLADLIDRYFGITIDKQYQRHDWSRRPLHKEHLDYARGDTHFLPALHELLTWRLEKAERVDHVEEECKLVESREWQSRGFDENNYLKIKGSGPLSDTAKRVLKRLFLFRDAEARRLDRPAYKVLGDKLMVEIAQVQPLDRDALDRLYPKKHTMKRRYGSGIVKAVRQGLKDDFPIPKLTKTSKTPEGPKARLNGRAAERVLLALKEWRNDLVQREKGYTPFSVASNGVLKAIAAAAPESLEELAEVPTVRNWQVRDHGAAMLDVVAKSMPAAKAEQAKQSPPKRRRRRRSSDS